MNENPITTASESKPSSAMAPMATMETVMGKLLDAARVEAVVGQPMAYGDMVIIPTAEVLSVAGFGLGYGEGGPAAASKGGEGRGGGGGGGGRVLSRPVAAIVVSPEGVRIEPIVDVTKVALAALTAAGFMVGMLARMSRGRARR
ncbi:MAG: hypothetical protein HY259_14180 [Chloroflexi bacterium]|nr:hypothetical protein [Chloroflexota bacterium]